MVINLDDNNKENNQVYELGFIFIPTITEDNIVVEFTKLKEVLQSNNGLIISDEVPKLISLSYEMSKIINNKKQKFNTGYFGWVKFDINKIELLKLKELLKNSETILRFLLIKTIKEDTRVPKKFIRGDVLKRKVRSTVFGKIKQPQEEIDKKEVDKKIAELVLE